MMAATETLAHFIAEMDPKKLPKEVIESAKDCILDTVGAALGGSTDRDIQGMIGELKRIDPVGEGALLGQRERLSLLHASIVNGSLAHTVEMDDVHKKAKVHAGAVVVPAALTLGEMLKVDGYQLLAAIVCGYEVATRIGMALDATSHRMKGWHATSTCGTFGAAAAAAKLFHFDAQQTTSALGLAGTQSSGLWAFNDDQASCKKFHAGMAAHGGILSALLVRGHMTGPKRILEAEDGGLLKAMSDRPSLSLVTEGLGKTYEILDVDRKPFACCRSMHPSITAILALKEEGLFVEEIEKIEVETYEVALKQCFFTRRPKNIAEARFCIPYGIAVALYDNKALLEQFSLERIQDPAVLELGERVVVYGSKKYNKLYPHTWGCAVTVFRKEGPPLIKEVLHAKGDPKNPLTRDELKMKFNDLASCLTEDRREDFISFIQTVETQKNVAEGIQLLTSNERS